MFDFMDITKSWVEVVLAGGIAGMLGSTVTLLKFDAFQDKKVHKLCEEHKTLGEKIEEMRETLSKEHTELQCALNKEQEQYCRLMMELLLEKKK